MKPFKDFEVNQVTYHHSL